MFWNGWHFPWRHFNSASGRDLLVHPVVEEGARGVTAYLPGKDEVRGRNGGFYFDTRIFDLFRRAYLNVCEHVLSGLVRCPHLPETQRSPKPLHSRHHELCKCQTLSLTFFFFFLSSMYFFITFLISSLGVLLLDPGFPARRFHNSQEA